MKILIAEDDTATRALLSAVTQQWGYDVIVCEDGEEAWDVMQQDDAPSLLLLDWGMPKMTGIELCERIRKQQYQVTPYIVMFTSRASSENIVEGLIKGVNDYILKPLDEMELKARLEVGERVLSRQSALYKAKNLLSGGDNCYRVLFEQSADPFFLYQDGQYIDCNRAAVDMLGCDSKEELLATCPSEFSAHKQPDGRLSLEKAVEMTQRGFDEGSHRFEWDHKKKGGEIFPVEVLLTAISIDEKKVLHITWKDISSSRAQQDALKLLAHYDVLTELPNRVLFADRFKQAVAQSKRTKKLLAVCFLDLDNFKPVNDHYGHEVGDQVLIEVAERIKMSLRGVDTVSRQGGDEFVLLLNGLERKEQGEATLKRMLNSIAQPYVINGVTHVITASCGVTINKSPHTGLNDLLREADRAMYEAKEAGKNRLKFYIP